ncbi:MAG: acyltransferase family protein, partial [Oscillospiraceae bacterium]|nr:acyltransferase family protein [Oscillospiraceae bacterium]
MPTLAQAPQSAAQKEERVWFWDNAKALLIFLVVLGHLLNASWAKGSFNILLVNIYLFHMPLFIFIAGYFSKRAVNAGQFPKRRIVGFLTIYAAITLFFWLIDCLAVRTGLVQARATPLRFFSASGAQWYMVAMVWWLLFGFALLSLKPGIKPWILLGAALLGGLLIGYESTAGDFLVFLRAVNFFPFFLAGLLCKSEWFQFLRKPLPRWIALAVLLLLIAWMIWKYSYLHSLWQILTGRHLYKNIAAVGTGLGALYRLGHYLLAGLTGLCILLVIPDRR